jgi:hypothetical protein
MDKHSRKRFWWKGVFDLQIDYKKRDVVSRYNNALYLREKMIL